MKWKLWIIVTTLAIGGAAWGATNDLSGLLQKGLFEEEANRNLDAAVQAYQSLVTAFDRDRKLAATAVFRLGECYRKLGKTNEAVLQYDRIVREFADEPTLATLSRQNLAGLRQSPVLGDLPLVGGRLDTQAQAARQEQKRLLEEEIKLAEQDLAEVKKQAELKSVPQAAVRSKEREVLKLRQQLAALNLDAAEQKRLLKEEIRLAEQDLAEVKEQVESKSAPQAALRYKELEVLKLRQQLAALNAAVEAPPSDASPTTASGIDDEEKEIRRLQALIRDSPDLLNAPGDDRLTPLCRAASKGQLHVAKFLLDHGAMIDRRSGNESPPVGVLAPLHFAVNGGHRAMVELLLAHGADTNARGGMGRTPLHIAVEKGFLAVVEALVAGKADVNARNDKGQTPLDLAKSDPSRAAIAALLRQHGAREDLPKPDSVSAKQSEGPGTATSVGGGKIIAGRIYISGQVRKQGPIDLLPGDNFTVAKAIVLAGGFTDSADKKKVLVVRASESGSATNKLELDMIEILEQGNLEKDVVLRPEDRVIVPSRLVPQ